MTSSGFHVLVTGWETKLARRCFKPFDSNSRRRISKVNFLWCLKKEHWLRVFWEQDGKGNIWTKNRTMERNYMFFSWIFRVIKRRKMRWSYVACRGGNGKWKWMWMCALYSVCCWSNSAFVKRCVTPSIENRNRIDSCHSYLYVTWFLESYCFNTSHCVRMDKLQLQVFKVLAVLSCTCGPQGLDSVPLLPLVTCL